MKVTVIVPHDTDRKTRDCLNEIVRQTNLALADIDRKIEELRSGNNG